jgi:predicted  nucleic acid-binding Zn-ribbon protein
MAGPATILRELHRLRRHAKGLQSEIERLPRLLKGQQAKIARQEEVAKEAHEVLKRLKLVNLEREGQLKATLQLIAKHERQLSESASKKEYDALRAEIASEKAKYKGIEDAILETMGEIEERTARLPEADLAVKQAKDQYAQSEKEAAGRQVSLHQQLEETLQSIKQIEEGLPPDVRPVYARQIQARGDDAMAAVENRTCMACYTEITAQAYNDLMLSQFVLCKSCGRILYLPE